MRIDEAVAGVVARGPGGVMLDLDGTLAPIVSRPEDVEVLPGVGTSARLVGRCVVALVSGRASEDVRRVVDVPGVRIDRDARARRRAAPREGHASRDRMRRRDGRRVGGGEEAAVAVHFRALPDADAAAEATTRGVGRVAAAHGLELVPGKAILELMPIGAPRKGDAVQALVHGEDLQAVLFAGDDVGDLDAFAALRRLRAAGRWTCAVAASGPDPSPAVVDAADLVVEGRPAS